jgi:MoaA/NifB/PqqE/SkfB family radical SAM enzyme
VTGELPQVVDLRLLGACNLRCPFCFGPRHEIGPRNVERFIELVQRLPALGVRAVVITGGEPTLVRALPRLLATAKRAGLRTVLSTNGTRLDRRLDDIAPHLDWVGLPLDADRSERNAIMRPGPARQFDDVVEVIPRIRREHPELRIKLGTVVCALNRDWVVPLADLAAGSLAPDVWKLYQVEASGYARDAWSKLELGDDEFDAVLDRASAAAARHGVPVTAYRRAERSGKYLFVEPNGDAMAVAGTDERVIGNVFADLASVVRVWQRHVDVDRLEGNVAATYPGV